MAHEGLTSLLSLLEGRKGSEEPAEDSTPNDPILFKAFAALKLAKTYFDQLLTTGEEGWDKSHPHLPRAAVTKTADLLGKAETQATSEVRKDRVSSFQSKSKRVLAKLDKLMGKLTEGVEDLVESTHKYGMSAGAGPYSEKMSSTNAQRGFRQTLEALLLDDAELTVEATAGDEKKVLTGTRVMLVEDLADFQSKSGKQVSFTVKSVQVLDPKR